jgi:hypothetical protein
MSTGLCCRPSAYRPDGLLRPSYVCMLSKREPPQRKASAGKHHQYEDPTNHQSRELWYGMSLREENHEAAYLFDVAAGVFRDH